jgi:hypothetical protein
MKWWKKGFNREATIIIKPAATGSTKFFFI